MLHPVKRLPVVNKTKMAFDVELSAFYNDVTDVSDVVARALPFLYPACSTAISLQRKLSNLQLMM